MFPHESSIEWKAYEPVTRAFAALGRTEDVKFSPAGSRLAFVGYDSNNILVVDLEVHGTPATPAVSLTACVEITSPALSAPHGVAFIDEHAIVVASRRAWPVILGVPPRGDGTEAIEARPALKIRGNPFRRVLSGGSACVSRMDSQRYEILVCNNFLHRVTRHVVEGGGNRRWRVRRNRVLLRKRLEIPDGIAVSPNRRWIAVSNHDRHSVALFENVPGLSPRSEPVGVLRRVTYPHGVCFTPDGSHVLVADAGAPFVHIYDANAAGDWSGERDPVVSCRVMDDQTYIRGRIGPQQGGPKGVDVHAGAQLVATTCAQQPLAFFDLRRMLGGERAWSPGS